MVRIRIAENRKTSAVGGLVSLIAVSTIIFFAATSSTPTLMRAPSISSQPLHSMDGDTCAFLPASAASSLAPSSQQRRDVVPSATARAEASLRKPIRVMSDSYPGYSAVAVDPTNNEVVMTDENLFSILVYDRTENTPPRARLSEPKRLIRGMNTEIEFQCALYVDPSNGDIYAVNNDTLGKLVIFPRNARGDVEPERFINTPHTAFGIAADEKHQEILLAIQDDSAVVTYRKTAKEDEPPIRLLQGEKTSLADPHGLALDPKKDLLYVSNWGSVNLHKPPPGGAKTGTLGRGGGHPNWPIGRNYAVAGSGKFFPPSVTIYQRDAKGDNAPQRMIQGPKTQLNWPTALAINPATGELYVANDPVHAVLVFAADADGDVAPIRVLQGPKTLLKNPTGVFFDEKNQELWVSNFGNHTATVYKPDASGDIPPLRVIRSGPLDTPAPMLGNPHVVTYDTKREEILVANCVAHPQIASFPRLAEKNAKATRSIAGQNTLITRTIHDMAYDPVRDEIIVPQLYAQAILTFRGSANGDVAPIRVIRGPHTQIDNPSRVAADFVHNEIFVPLGNRLLVFPREADGDVTPIRIIEGSDTQISAGTVAVDPVHNLLIVAGGAGNAFARNSGDPKAGQVAIYNRTDNGNVKPQAIIRGPKSQIRNTGLLALYPPRGLFLMGVTTGERASAENFVGVWSVNDNGDVPPRWTIGGPHGTLRQVRGITLDSKHKDVIISDKFLNSVFTFSFPEIFARR